MVVIICDDANEKGMGVIYYEKDSFFFTRFFAVSVTITQNK